MNLYATVVLLAIVAVVQTAVAPAFTFFGTRPDLMLVVVVGWGVLRGVEEGLIWGAIGGMVLDLLSGSPFGVFTFSLILVSFITGLGEINVFRANILLPGATVAVATMIYNLLVLAMLQLMGRPVTWTLGLIRLIAPAVVLNLICLAILYGPLRWLHRRTGREELPIG
jgi:rod shape-determining protein MreD